MKKIIYADNAATTRIDDCVLEIMIPWLRDEYANASQPYSFARKTKLALMEARKTIAESINALPEEIFFTSGGTESDNWAIKGVILSSRSKRETITSSIEHHAILHSCEAIEGLGYPVRYLAPNKSGIITPDLLESTINDNTCLVSIMLSNNEIGTIEPIKELADVAHKHGALFHTDAVQAVGHIPIDVNRLGVDMLSASAHKFNGPKGVGFLYIRKGTAIHPFNNGGSQEKGLRAGTENVAGIVGMAKALEENCTHMNENMSYIRTLENSLINQIQELDFIRNGADYHIPGSISLSFKDNDGEAILHRLDFKGICVSTGSACDSVNTQISHVISAVKVPTEYASGTVRISLGKHNTLSEIDSIAAALKEIIN